MNNLHKMKTLFTISGILSIASTVLKCIAMFTEYDKDSGYFALSSPINVIATLLPLLSIAFFAIVSFTFKPREIFPVINYSSSCFRFFSSTSGCLMLVYAYVKFGEYRAEKSSLTNANAKQTLFLILIVLFSLVSFVALMMYAFGKNEKNDPKRSFLALTPAAVVMLRSIEIQFDANVAMNDPLKIAFQVASLVLMLALVYLAKCEFDVSEADPKMRFITLLSVPVFVLAFAVPTIVCYYAKVSTVFSYLVDSLLYISLCGFVVASYTPCKKAKPICDAMWSSYDEEVANLNEGACVDDDLEEHEYSDEFTTDEPGGSENVKDSDYEKVTKELLGDDESSESSEKSEK